MSFRKETNYHSSRAYGRKPGAEKLVTRLLLRIALPFTWATRQIGKLLHSGVAPMQASSSERHFAQPATQQRAHPARRTISEIFPIPNSNGRARKIGNDSLF